MNTSVPVKCEVCEAPSRYWVAINGYDLYRCSKCSHCFVHPRPSQDELEVFYQGGEYYDKAESEQTRLLHESVARVRRLARFCRRYQLPRQLFDVGCASGYFIQQAINENWQAIGIERSDEMATRARANSGAEVVTGVLEDIQLESGPYPVVTAWEVLEHALDPRAFFAALASNVSQGGLIAISTPLANGIPARILGRKFPMLIPPEHLSLFTRKSINLLAAEFGLVEVDYRSFSNLGIRSLASGFAKILFRKNFTELAGMNRVLCLITGAVFGWAPKIVDMAGWGSEMEIVFRNNKL